MSNNDEYYGKFQQPELEVIEIEQESDHAKLMKAYKRIYQKIDTLIEKKRKSKPPVEE